MDCKVISLLQTATTTTKNERMMDEEKKNSKIMFSIFSKVFFLFIFKLLYHVCDIKIECNSEYCA